MSLRPIYGHEALLHRLEGALASGRFPQAALFTGPIGVGKQRLALWVAQWLLCEEVPRAPCQECRSCKQVLGLRHTDLHWFVPIPRPKASAVEKQVEQAAEALADVMEQRRADPLYRRPDRMTSHSLASIRLLQRVVAVTPFQASRKVVILGDAERLVVQEASQEAANALLKVLEEPPSDTVIILTASEPQSLLPTIRSRLVPTRVGRVTDEAVEAFLRKEVEPPVQSAALRRRTLLAEGCPGKALWSDEDGDDSDRAAQALLDSVARGPVRWAPLALAQPPWAARGDFSGLLDALAVKLRDRLVEAANAGESLEGYLKALERVDETRVEAKGNANPQLALAVLAGDLERLL